MSKVQKVHMLYMEDDPAQARLVQKRLTRAGYRVDLAPNGEKGLAMIAEGDYEVVLVDHNMPMLTGLEVIQKLAEHESSPPAVMITGEGSEQIAVHALKLGAADYIVKDIQNRYLELVEIVLGQVIEQRRLAKAKVEAEEERERLILELKEALSQVKTLRGMLPICAGCKKVRDDSGYWQQIETYIMEHSEAQFSHGLCDECTQRLYPETYELLKNR